MVQEVGNYSEQKQLLIHTLELERLRGNDTHVARTLVDLSDVNRQVGAYEEGIRQAKEALEILERIGNTVEQPHCLGKLAWLLLDDKQLEAAQEAAARAITLVTEEGQEYLVCDLHRILGKIWGSKGEKEKAIHHFETALGIASPPNWDDQLFGFMARWFSYFVMKKNTTMQTSM